MLKPKTTKQFKRDFKKAKKQNKKLENLENVMVELTNERQLSPRNKDHPLIGNFSGSRECHIEPDWLLIYRIDKNASEIIFERIGSHSELFE